MKNDPSHNDPKESPQNILKAFHFSAESTLYLPKAFAKKPEGRRYYAKAKDAWKIVFALINIAILLAQLAVFYRQAGIAAQQATIAQQQANIQAKSLPEFTKQAAAAEIAANVAQSTLKEIQKSGSDTHQLAVEAKVYAPEQK